VIEDASEIGVFEQSATAIGALWAKAPLAVARFQ
jgi:hypothetical protein